MITEKDLQEAIAKCEGQLNPNANTCLKLAAYYTIMDHMTENDEHTVKPVYSFAPPPANVVTYVGDSEFAREINGADCNVVWSVIDELMDTLLVVNPRLYTSVMRKIRN